LKKIKNKWDKSLTQATFEIGQAAASAVDHLEEVTSKGDHHGLLKVARGVRLAVQSANALSAYTLADFKFLD